MTPDKHIPPRLSTVNIPGSNPDPTCTNLAHKCTPLPNVQQGHKNIHQLNCCQRNVIQSSSSGTFNGFNVYYLKSKYQQDKVSVAWHPFSVMWRIIIFRWVPNYDFYPKHIPFYKVSGQLSVLVHVFRARGQKLANTVMKTEVFSVPFCSELLITYDPAFYRLLPREKPYLGQVQALQQWTCLRPQLR